MRAALRYLWASPASLVGLAIAAPCLAAGGTARRVAGVLEVSGGSVAGRLRRVGLLRGSVAVTFGHVVLASDRPFLERSRAHERVHVRQYERWGVLFFPLYLLASAAAVARGRHPYTGNTFEEAAFRHERENPIA